MSGLRDKIYYLYRAKLFPHCRGIYETSTQAKEHVRSGYNDSEFAETVTRNLSAPNMMNHDTVDKYGFYELRFLIPLLLAKTEDPLNIIDFGGATAGSYFMIKSFLTKMDINKNIKFTVVETEELSKRAQEKLGSEELGFISFSEFKSQLDNRSIYADVFMASSSVHYTDEPLELLSQIARADIFRCIWITRTPLLTDKKQFTSIQRADYGKMMGIKMSKVMDYSITFMELGKVIDIFVDAGYRHILELKDGPRMGAPSVIVDYYSLLFYKSLVADSLMS